MRFRVVLTSAAVAVTVLVAGTLTPAAGVTGGSVTAWGEVWDWVRGDDVAPTPPPGLNGVTAIAAGSYHSLALRDDGTVVAWGTDYNQLGQEQTAAAVPAALTDPSTANVIAIAAGAEHSLALRADGSVLAWGRNQYGQSSVPRMAKSGVTGIAASAGTSLAVRGDGRVVAWGNNVAGQTDVPNGLTDAVAVAAGASHSLALKRNGIVVSWGGQFDFLAGRSTLPPRGLGHVKAIAAGGRHSLALKQDGTVVGWGPVASEDGEDGTAGDVPEGLTHRVTAHVAAIAAGADHSLALKKDGTVVAWGSNRDGQLDVPDGLTGVDAIAAGTWHSMAMTGSELVAGKASTSGTAPLVASGVSNPADEPAQEGADPAAVRPDEVRVLFADGFESGTLSAWSGGLGLKVDAEFVDEGDYAALGSMNGEPAYAYRDLDFAAPRVTMRAAVHVRSLEGTEPVGVAKVHTPEGRLLAELYLTPEGVLGLRNGVTDSAVDSSHVLKPGSWHTLTLCMVVDGNNSKILVALDDEPVEDLTGPTKLGTTGVGQIQVGEDEKHRKGVLAYDTVAVTGSETLPASFQQSQTSATTCDLVGSWLPSREPAGSAGGATGGATGGSTGGSTGGGGTGEGPRTPEPPSGGGTPRPPEIPTEEPTTGTGGSGTVSVGTGGSSTTGTVSVGTSASGTSGTASVTTVAGSTSGTARVWTTSGGGTTATVESTTQLQGTSTTTSSGTETSSRRTRTKLDAEVSTTAGYLSVAVDLPLSISTLR